MATTGRAADVWRRGHNKEKTDMHLRTTGRRTRELWLFRRRVWLRWLLPGCGCWSTRRSTTVEPPHRQINLGRVSITWWSR